MNQMHSVYIFESQSPRQFNPHPYLNSSKLVHNERNP